MVLSWMIDLEYVATFRATFLLKNFRSDTYVRHWQTFAIKFLQRYCRSSHQRCCVKIGVLRNFKKFTGKHQCQSLFFNKVSGLKPATLFKERLWRRCFPVSFVKFLRTPFYIEHLWWLLFILSVLAVNFLDKKSLSMMFGRIHFFASKHFQPVEW